VSASGDGDGAPSVIVTKVRPPRRRRDLQTRTRLIDYVSNNVDRKLLLLSAPAGYGKTSLLVDFAAASQLPVCWYRLDPADADPPVFFAHLLASLRQRYPACCPRTAATLAAVGAVDPETLVGSLVNEIDEGIDEFFLLVFDDYQHVDASLPVNRAVDALLYYLPPNCQVAIATRTVPSKLTLTRLAGEGQVAGIGQEQLRFTTAEIRQLYHAQHGRALSEMESERLVRESEGWAAALVLGSQRLMEGMWVGGRRPSSDRGQLFAFLAREVFEQQPDDVRDFLVASAVLENLSPALCDAALGRTDSAEMLRWLESHNVFVMPIEGEDAWYRYHQLFHEFLLTLLAPADAPRVAGLHRRAAAWYDAAGRVDLVIQHLLAAGDFDAAAERMEADVDRAHAEGRWQAIVGWGEALPEEVRARHPRLVRRLGSAYVNTGHAVDALPVFAGVIERYTELGDDEGVAEALVSRAPAWRIIGQPDRTVADCRRALALTRDPEGGTAAQAYRNLGGVLYARGEMTDAAREMLRALACFERLGAEASAALVETELAAVFQLSGDIERAVRHATSAIRRWEALGNLGGLALALNNLGTARQQQGRFEEAERWLTEAVEKARLGGARETEARAVLGLADVLADRAELARAREHYERGLAQARVIRDWALVTYALAAGAEAARLAGDLDAARDLLAQAREAIGTRYAPFEAAMVDFARGALAMDERAYARAAEDLEDAALGFGRCGTRREAVRAMLYRCATAQRAGDAGGTIAWRARAEEVIAAQGYRDAFAPDLARLPEVFPSEGLARAPAAASLVAREREAAAAGAVAEAGPPRLVVLALGAPEVRVAGQVVDQKAWQTLTARDLFLWLMDRPGGISRDELMAAFWPESPEVRARSSLHSTLYRVRRALADRAVVQVDFERYFVPRPGGVFYDVTAFEDLLAHAGEGDDASRAATLEAALALARGPYLDGVPGEWCALRRHDLDLRVTDAWVALGEVRGRLDRLPGAIEAFQRALALDDLREEAYLGLMRALAASGARAQALRQYEAYERHLAEALGAAPGAEITALYRLVRDAGSSSAA
jgi:LuxR family transcriptional regulator, maltose regulon positive regulatory protein